jgi:hypothetical protein
VTFAIRCITTVSTLAVALATGPGPYYYYEQILARAVEATLSESLQGVAMQLLRDVAEGHPERVTSETASRLGVGPGQLKLLGSTFAKDPGVRARAYGAIGRTGLAEALEYLQALTPAQVGDLGPRESHEAWPAAQIALQEARLMQIKTPQEEVTFLENAMVASFDSYSTAKIHLWATQKLCDMGSSKSLPVIEKRLRSLYSRIGEAETSFCRERMQIVQSHRNRAKALGSVLNIGTSSANQRLTRWAISELGAMNSAEADAELDRFSAEIQAIHPLGRNPVFSSFEDQISRIRAAKLHSKESPQP